jgi:RNA polymerase sigma-70 factor, ECF subfamily
MLCVHITPEAFLDDNEAVARLKRGDISGLAALVERYQVRAVRTAYLITHDLPLAEDVAQAAFLRAYHAIDQFDSSRPFAPWFLRSVANAAVQAVRRSAYTVPLESESVNFADLLPDSAHDPASEAESAEFKQAVWDALAKLPPEQRAAVVLRYYLDFSEHEMSAVLDAPPGTVKSRLYAARKQLRGLLGRLTQSWEV